MKLENRCAEVAVQMRNCSTNVQDPSDAAISLCNMLLHDFCVHNFMCIIESHAECAVGDVQKQPCRHDSINVQTASGEGTIWG